MKYEYSVNIAWSEEDQAYLAGVVELPGCLADGATPEEALANVREVAAEWLKVANEEARPIPRPMSREDFDKNRLQFQQRVNQEIQQRVEQAVSQAVQQIAEQASEQVARQLKAFFQQQEKVAPGRRFSLIHHSQEA